MAEQQTHGQECVQEVLQAQEMELYLNNNELVVLIEVFEEHNATKAYLGIKTSELCKAWIKCKLNMLGMTPSFAPECPTLPNILVDVIRSMFAN
jgi:hypothetical protein